MIIIIKKQSLLLILKLYKNIGPTQTRGKIKIKHIEFEYLYLGNFFFTNLYIFE